VVYGHSVLGLGKSVGVHSRDGLEARWIVAAYEAAGKGLEKGAQSRSSREDLSKVNPQTSRVARRFWVARNWSSPFLRNKAKLSAVALRDPEDIYIHTATGGGTLPAAARAACKR
jgi:hypothetical protein